MSKTKKLDKQLRFDLFNNQQSIIISDPYSYIYDMKPDYFQMMFRERHKLDPLEILQHSLEEYFRNRIFK